MNRLSPESTANPYAVPWLRSRRLWFLAAVALALPAVEVFAQRTHALPAPSVLKKMSVEQLMDIVVTSVTKRPEKLSEAASAIQVITSDEIRRSGATSLPEALRLATNLEVAQIDSRQWAITARGFNNVFANKMLVLIDGRTVYTPLYAGVYWDVQDTMLLDVDRIEVISGPGATQWGANAVDGVINVTTKNAKDTQGGLFVGGAGTELRTSGEARYGGKLAPNLYGRVYAKYFDRGDSMRSNGRASNDAWSMGQTGFRIDRDAPTGDLLTLQGDVYSGSIDQFGPENIRVNGVNLLGRWSRKLAENSDVKLQVYYDRTHRRIPGSFTQDIDTYDADFQHRSPLGLAHDLVWGLGFRLVADDVVNTPANAFLPPQVSRTTFNAFVQDEVALRKDRLYLTVGTKVEHNDYTGFEIQPSVRLAWMPAMQQTIWGAVSRAVRTPSRIDRDLFSPATPPYRIAGGEKVVSEKLIAYEAGYRVQFEPNVALSLATFLNHYDDLRSLEPLNPPLAFPVEASSGLRGRSAGAELAVEWRAMPTWRLRAGWTELRVHSERQSGTVDRGTGGSIARDPNHQLTLRSRLDLSANWECDADLRYVAAIRNQAVPGYTECDLRLGWRPAQSWEISILGRNLLHSRHAEFNTPGFRRELQRGIYGKATWGF
ncbi:MAG: TonB-dependent receptor [Opitutaceae bacterium]